MNMLTDFFVSVLTAIIMGLILSYPAMLLWNDCFVPAVTFAKEVGYIQMWGIFVLIGILSSKVTPNRDL